MKQIYKTDIYKYIHTAEDTESMRKLLPLCVVELLCPEPSHPCSPMPVNIDDTPVAPTPIAPTPENPPPENPPPPSAAFPPCVSPVAVVSLAAVAKGFMGVRSSCMRVRRYEAASRSKNASPACPCFIDHITCLSVSADLRWGVADVAAWDGDWGMGMYMDSTGMTMQDGYQVMMTHINDKQQGIP